MAEIKVTSQELRMKAQELKRYNDQLKNMSDELEQIEVQLSAKWEGDSHDAFVRSFRDDMRYIHEFYKLIAQYIIAMNEMAKEYDRMEHRNVEIARRRDGFPGNGCGLEPGTGHSGRPGFGPMSGMGHHGGHGNDPIPGHPIRDDSTSSYSEKGSGSNGYISPNAGDDSTSLYTQEVESDLFGGSGDLVEDHPNDDPLLGSDKAIVEIE